MRRIHTAFTLIAFFIMGMLNAQEATPTPEPVPDPVPVVDEGGYDIINVLLIGLGIENPNNVGLTDALIIVSINRTLNHVSMVSIPRDLYVYVPEFGMNKINTAYYFGETRDGEGEGIPLLEATIRHNLGLEIDYYALVNFVTLGELIDAVGGIDITVDCTIEDWKLKEPDLDRQDPANWEMFTLRAGYYHMNSDRVLWYVRSRRTSSDLDRGRRQQDVLRALWRKLRSQDTLAQLPALWDELAGTVQTNLTLADALEMMPMALTIETSDMSFYTFSARHEVSRFISPAGQEVLRPNPEAVASLMQQVVLSSSSGDAEMERPTVAIVNVTGIGSMARVAADRLELEGFQTVVLDEVTSPREYNKIIDYTGETRDSALSALQRVLRVTDEGVEIAPDPNPEYDFKIYLGSQYTYWTCTRDVIQPASPTQTPENAASSG